MPKRICVFCGSNVGARPCYAAAAMSLAQHLAPNNIGIVHGGGNVGLMGILADAALAADGDVIGVIPHSLGRKELAHTGLADLRIVGSMHERKALMAEVSDTFIALPGGHGVAEQFVKPANREIVISDTDPVSLVHRLLNYDLPFVEKWMDRREI